MIQKSAMKVVLLSLGGSEGKTMIVTQMLHPHMPKARILCVDSANETASEFGIKNCEKHSGDEFNSTYHSLMSAAGDVIVDVGGSKECKEFMAGMLAIDGSDAITTVIVPSTPSSKGQSCAIETIERLIDDGVDKSKIKVIFTGTKKDTAVEFAQLIAGMEESGLVPDLNLTIAHSVLFNEMIENKELISKIIADETDYKEKAASRKNGDATDYVGKLIRQKMARKTVWPNLQAVYKHLFGSE
ncbi:hypothetical protein COW64_09030 [bacterium (Candidatus Blackallbacteria) CG18_big_fil_WC_8_21_14_2_50_49_26]|nr:MAG: hypothetical protein COW64_09030 [bacterium (Candidatus Blackallbacteria) CG18_big_fil_WC_8_21_14_2_50_49_26]